ncbi:hypothetical protein BSPP4475_02745 [Brevibacillus aydinogluensis]|uniref:Uncharacterized protein n=1 Tax=Brevibacillus aydinogluensis TaxID=927786 RepID=A0AA48RGJ9_9BACL|nr:hypothetical protein BSPP4475_02745 [Brevibacillus aydinogluensis]
MSRVKTKGTAPRDGRIKTPQTTCLRGRTEDKRFIELASTKNDFQAERPAHSSTEAEDNVHRMEGWAKRAPLTTCSAEKRRRGNQQGTQVSLPRNTQMFVPCPRLVLERTSFASVLGVKRASGPDLPCAANFVYTLPPQTTCLRGLFLHNDKRALSLIFRRGNSNNAQRADLLWFATIAPLFPDPNNNADWRRRVDRCHSPQHHR